MSLQKRIFIVWLLLFIKATDAANGNLPKDVIIIENNNNNLLVKNDIKNPLAFNLGNVNGRVQIKWKPETFIAKNSNLLNDLNESDWLFFNRSTVDINLDILYGKGCYGYDVAEFFATLRNKATWGNPETIAPTTETDIKLLEAVFGTHRHAVVRHILWIREIWLKFSVNEAFGLLHYPHTFTLGAFPFELGRGISLGSAYAVNPRFLGFYSDNSIDQYAYGFKYTGEFCKPGLSYDLYGAILENKSDSFSNTAMKILGQEFGRRNKQERGSGKVNYLIAGRLKWMPVKNPNRLVAFEPYALFNHAPEQFVEFLGDASSELGTLGLAGEFVYNNWEWGFDSAVNVGAQQVKGWDRNKIEFENRGGFAALINSRVVTENPNIVAKPPKVLFDPNSSTGREIQRIINESPQNASENGKQIGSVGGVNLFNDLHRFRNPHKNKFQGWMAIADAAYWLYKREVKIAATVGAASGDRSPNQNLDDPNSVGFDGNFKGFIGLQEIYSGQRVQSAFFLGGAGRIPRPLDIPFPGEGIDELPQQISGFTNLILVGAGLHWYPKICSRAIAIRPNILAYWQEHATNKFDRVTQQSSLEKARNFYGTELNVFADAELLKDLKIFLVASVFIPGAHFRDIAGTPLTKDQKKLIDQLDVTGVDSDLLPLLGSDNAYTLNIGLEYRY